jgi:hypothetical protein
MDGRELNKSALGDSDFVNSGLKMGKTRKICVGQMPNSQL